MVNQLDLGGPRRIHRARCYRIQGILLFVRVSFDLRARLHDATLSVVYTTAPHEGVLGSVSCRA